MRKEYRALYFSVLVLFLALSSCTPQKKLLYLQGIETEATAKEFTYRLQPRDVLMINVQSSDETSSKAFNSMQSPIVQSANPQNFDGSGLSLTGYFVNDSGCVVLPVVGSVKVAGLKVEEAQELIVQAISRYVIEPWVSVRLVSFKVTFLGEVKNPGIYRTYDNKLTILDALGMAGDLTEYGNRQKIVHIRQNGNKQQITHINLTSRKLLESDSFFLMPGDIVYVPSLKTKSWGFANAITPITLTLSLISTTILIINFVK